MESSLVEAHFVHHRTEHFALCLFSQHDLSHHVLLTTCHLHVHACRWHHAPCTYFLQTWIAPLSCVSSCKVCKKCMCLFHAIVATASVSVSSRPLNWLRSEKLQAHDAMEFEDFGARFSVAVEDYSESWPLLQEVRHAVF